MARLGGSNDEQPTPLETLAGPTSHQRLPEGTMSVLVGVVVNGAMVYLFLVLPARVGLIGPDDYAGLAASWFVVFTVVTGLLTPLEQQITIFVTEARARGFNAMPDVRRTIQAALVPTLSICALLLLSTPILGARLLGNSALMPTTVAAIVAYVAFQSRRGLLAGRSDFNGYGRLLIIDGVVRAGGAIVLVIMSVRWVPAYGILIGAPALIAALVSRRSRFHDTAPVNRQPTRGLGRRFAWLVTAQTASQLVLNFAPLLAPLLADESQRDEAGRIAAGFLVARIPLFLFQAVQTALLPRLIEMATTGRLRDLVRELTRLCGLIITLGAVGALAAASLGPSLIDLSFGSEFGLERWPLTIMVLAAVAVAVGMTLTQGLVALERLRSAALAWGAGLVAGLLLLLVLDDLAIRVATAFAAASVAACTALALAVRAALRAERAVAK